MVPNRPEVIGMAKRGKPRIRDDEGVKDSSRREDEHRQDKRPKPLGPATSQLDQALAEGIIEPDPETPSRTPRD
jgi:hypothetical protein